MTVHLANRLQASKGKGKGKGKDAAEHSLQPKAWDDMSENERWWFYEHWHRHLRKTMDEAEAKCHRVQAPRFIIVEIS